MFDIELKSVTKRYPGTDEPAVNNLSLAVEKGSIITLLGPSGCGKSTTLRLIAGFERTDAGSISLAGKAVSDSHTWIPPEKRGIGMVFQEQAGEEVYISIRPDSFELDPEGQIKGRIKESTYTGESIDAVVEVALGNGTRLELLTHIHPEKEVKVGDSVRFKVLPHFIAVIRHD
jgi:ABC-type Fe3+/spermidine/putrescine transport system ATPase subunit